MLCVALRFVDSCLVLLQWKPTVHLVCRTFSGVLSQPPPSLLVGATYTWSCVRRYCIFWTKQLGDVASFGRNNALEILHLLDETTPTVAPLSKEIECCVLLPDAPPMHPVVCYDTGVSQHQTPRGNAAWFGATWALQPLVPSGMDSSK
jgi:hypothetical protein